MFTTMLIKRLAARLPHRWQAELKRVHFGRQIARDTFNTSEAEFKLLDGLVRAGDWVIDIGANVGQYTKRMSDLVGPSGRVVAFEPVPATFALLAANAERFRYANVTLINAAVSERLDVMGMSIPRFGTGLVNYYEARITAGGGETLVLTMPIDSMPIEHPVSLVKIDAEGHEAFVIAGMRRLIQRHKPTMIVETGSAELISAIEAMGYRVERSTGSSNVVCRPLANAN